MNSLPELIDQLSILRGSLQSQLDRKSVYLLGKFVDELGYQNAEQLKGLGVDDASFTEEAVDLHRQYLKQHPKDGVALNNLAVLLANSGHQSLARPLLEQALAQLPADSNVHQNLRIVDILLHKKRSAWHNIPGKLIAGSDTLLAYFDPHAM